MSAFSSLTTTSVLQAFSQEIALHEGSVRDTFDDGERLFVRSVLPRVKEVRTGDRLQGGVALRACDGQVWVHPYVFRLVCKNGAIMAHAVTSRHVVVTSEHDLEVVHEAVRECCADEVFATSFDEIRSARDIHADMALNLLPLLSRLRGHGSERLLQEIMRRFFDDGDRTRFGFMNAVTSVARDTADPETKWKLEELGGGVPAQSIRSNPKKPARGSAAAREPVLAS